LSSLCIMTPNVSLPSSGMIPLQGNNNKIYGHCCPRSYEMVPYLFARALGKDLRTSPICG
jgi:hypothetical protein